MTMLEISPPRGFDFNQTIAMLQRGPHDPINRIENNTWTRCFRMDKKVVLIQTQHTKTLQTEVLQGTLSPKVHKALIEEALGLDDPILLNQVKDIPYAEKIESVLGLSVPGYPDIFEALVQIIMGQQVSVVVANKVRANFTNTFGGNVAHKKEMHKHFPHPHTVLKATIEELRKLGLSQVKCKAILSLADAFHHDIDIQYLTKNSDMQEIRYLLTSLYGIGDWTVDWLLLRGFRRFEVIPNTDLAVRKAFTWWLNKKALMSMEAVKRYEKKLYPYGGVIAYRVLCAYSKAQQRQGEL